MKQLSLICILILTATISCTSALVKPSPDRPVQVVMMDDIDIKKLGSERTDIGEESSPFWLPAGKTELGAYYFGPKYWSNQTIWIGFTSAPGDTWIICSGVYKDEDYPLLEAFKVLPDHIKKVVENESDRLPVCRQYFHARRDAQKKT